MIHDAFDELEAYEIDMNKFVYNENVVAQMSHETEDYIIDDEDEWYNQTSGG